jgi:SAM-dependent methyltransferase
MGMSQGWYPFGAILYNGSMNITDYNRKAWDKLVEQGNPWTIPVTSAQVEAARRGEWSVVLTPSIPVPRAWFGDLRGKDVLLLASGGGQQGPILAAAGASVTVFDNSPRQLERDRMVAQRDGLEISTRQGDMRDLSVFADASFDLIFHPVSNVFVDDVYVVWREAYRVLRLGGTLLAGFNNPLLYLFDLEKAEKEGIYQVAFKLPHADIEAYTEEERMRLFGPDAPLEWSHSLDEQIGGQLAAGFLLAGFYEDKDPTEKLCQYTPLYIATRAIKPTL